MRHLIRAVLAATLLAGPAAGIAHAVTISDLINLRANGVSDDILVALIQSDGTVFKLTAEDVVALKKRGLSDRVVVAMLLSGKRAAEPVVAEYAPGPEPIVVQQPAAPPVVHVTQQVTQTVEQTQVETRYVPYPVAVPVYARPSKEEKAPPPQYWGYNGKQRPDSWRAAPESTAATRAPAKSDSKSEKPAVIKK